MKNKQAEESLLKVKKELLEEVHSKIDSVGNISTYDRFYNIGIMKAVNVINKELENLHWP